MVNIPDFGPAFDFENVDGFAKPVFDTSKLGDRIIADSSVIDDTIRAVSIQRVSALDDHLQHALALGVGVGVIEYPPVVHDDSISFTAKMFLSMHIPSGEIYHFPSPESYEAWKERQ